MKLNCSSLLFSISMGALFSLAQLPVLAQTESGQGSSVKLFGRIDQLEVSPEQIPKLDLDKSEAGSNGPSVEQSQSSPLSGKIVEFFPQAMVGTWGGNISVLRRVAADSQETSALSKYEADAFVPGLTGNINFKFRKSHARISERTELEPPLGRFDIPLRDTMLGEKARALLASGSSAYLSEGRGCPGPFRAGGRQALVAPQIKDTRLTEENLNSVTASFSLSTDFRNGTTLAGQGTKSRLIRNVLRQLDGSTYEQDLVYKNITGKQKYVSFGEWTIRLHREPDGETLSFKMAEDRYDSAGQFGEQIEYEGQVKHGVEADTADRWVSVQRHPRLG